LAERICDKIPVKDLPFPVYSALQEKYASSAHYCAVGKIYKLYVGRAFYSPTIQAHDICLYGLQYNEPLII